LEMIGLSANFNQPGDPAVNVDARTCYSSQRGEVVPTPYLILKAPEQGDNNMRRECGIRDLLKELFQACHVCKKDFRATKRSTKDNTD